LKNYRQNTRSFGFNTFLGSFCHCVLRGRIRVFSATPVWPSKMTFAHGNKTLFRVSSALGLTDLSTGDGTLLTQSLPLPNTSGGCTFGCCRHSLSCRHSRDKPHRISIRHRDLPAIENIETQRLGRRGLAGLRLGGRPGCQSHQCGAGEGKIHGSTDHTGKHTRDSGAAQTSRITGMISGRRWVCLFRNRFQIRADLVLHHAPIAALLGGRGFQDLQDHLAVSDDEVFDHLPDIYYSGLRGPSFPGTSRSPHP
jgi:hypothetical protein